MPLEAGGSWQPATGGGSRDGAVVSRELPHAATAVSAAGVGAASTYQFSPEFHKPDDFKIFSLFK